MGGAIPVAVTAVGAGLGAGVGTVAAVAGKDHKEGDPTDKDGSQNEAGEGRSRCSECKRRGERYCGHSYE